MALANAVSARRSSAAISAAVSWVKYGWSYEWFPSVNCPGWAWTIWRTWRPAEVAVESTISPVGKIVACTPRLTRRFMIASESPIRPPMSKVSATPSMVRLPWLISRLGAPAGTNSPAAA